jgi:hypothetical protein
MVGDNKMANNHPVSLQTQPAPARPPRERGLGYALLGGLAITLVSMIIGGIAFAWLLLAARGPAVPDLLPADTQLYLALMPNVGGVVEVNQLRQALRDDLAITEHEDLLLGVARLAAVPLGDGNLGTWLESELGVAVRGVDAAGLAGADPAATLLRDGELVFFFGSKNDPQAAAFLEKHRAAREERGETISVEERGEVTLYTQTGGPPSPIAAFALIEHYVVFSNSRSALEALADAGQNQRDTLAEQPAFNQIRPGPAGLSYSDGSADADAARLALRALLLELSAE